MQTYKYGILFASHATLGAVSVTVAVAVEFVRCFVCVALAAMALYLDQR